MKTPTPPLMRDLAVIGARTRLRELNAEASAILELYPEARNGAPPVVAPALGRPKKRKKATRHISPAKRAKLSAAMRKAWNAKAAEPDINPRTGEPYKMKAEARAKIARAAKRRVRSPEGRRSLLNNLSKAYGRATHITAQAIDNNANELAALVAE